LNRLPEIRKFISEEAKNYPDMTVNYYGGDPRIKFVVSADGSALDINPYSHYQQSQQGIGVDDIINISGMNFYQVMDLLDQKGVTRNSDAPPRPEDPEVARMKKIVIADPPPELPALRDRCFELSVQNYVYEVCFFQKIVQKEKHSNKEFGTTPYTLGHYAKYDAATKTLHYEGGQWCGDKPRKAQVVLQCGTEDRLLAEKEDPACTYIFTFSSPSACAAGETPKAAAHSEL